MNGIEIVNQMSEMKFVDCRLLLDFFFFIINKYVLNLLILFGTENRCQIFSHRNSIMKNHNSNKKKNLSHLSLRYNILNERNIFCLAWNTANNIITPGRFSNTNNEWNNDWHKYGGKAINMKLVVLFSNDILNRNVFDNE